MEAVDADLMRQLKKGSPSFIVATALIADCVLAITDKSFGNPVIILCVTVVLILLFGISNYLFIESESLISRIIGWGLWLFALVIVPLTVMLSKGWSPIQLYSQDCFTYRISCCLHYIFYHCAFLPLFNTKMITR